MALRASGLLHRKIIGAAVERTAKQFCAQWNTDTMKWGDEVML